MKCKEYKELLIDYMHDELSSDDRAMVKEHLDSCIKCLDEFKEYTQIQMAAQEVELPEVSSEILERISNAANEDLKKSRKPFWKKWSYSPVLVPALTTAIALSVWFYYGHDAVNIVPEASYSSKEVTHDIRAEAIKPESDNTANFADDNAKMDNAVVLEEQTDLPEETALNQTPERPQAYAREQLSTSPAVPELSDPEFAEESGSANLSSQERLAMAPQKKKVDDCEVSIRTNEAIVNSTTPASILAQQKSYKVLAQCYEQQGDFDKAISNYINLVDVAPEESSFANGRIQEIRKRIKLENEQQLSNPAPVN